MASVVSRANLRSQLRALTNTCALAGSTSGERTWVRKRERQGVDPRIEVSPPLRGPFAPKSESKSRADGEASAYCLWWRSHTDTVVFALLLTPGPHAARQLERLKDGSVREDRLILGDYELVQRPREGKHAPRGLGG